MKMCAALAEQGYQVTLLNPDHPEAEPIEGTPFDFYGVPTSFAIQYLPYYRHRLGWVRSAISAARYAQGQQHGLIYGRDINALAAMAVAGLSVGIELHGPAYAQKAIKRPLYRRFFHSDKCVLIVAISEALRQILINQGLPPQKIVVAHDGADRQPAPQYRPPSAKLRIGYVGHLYRGRGVDVIFEMAEALPEHEFVIIGGRSDDIAYWKGRLPKSGNIELKGFVPPAATVALRAACDVLLAPYQEDLEIYGSKTNTSAYMSPLKIFEYMSAGRAIVVSDLPVLREVMNEHNALLVPSDDPQAWIGAVKRLADNPDLAQRLGRQAYRDFDQRYSWQQRAGELMNLLKTRV